MQRSKRVYLIGIDSTPLWLLKRLKNEKGFEPFKKFMERGRILEMQSTYPPITNAAWPSIYTGLNPGEHGVFDFFNLKSDYKLDLTFYDAKENPPFWEILAENGKKCLIVNPATVTELPSAKNIDMITGFPLPYKTNNSKLREFMSKYGFDKESEADVRYHRGEISIEQATNELVEQVERRSIIASNMLRGEKYDFAFICFTETDRIQHFTLGRSDWKEFVAPIYAKVGQFLEQIMEIAEKEHSLVMLVSDHGGEGVRKRFFINSWLIQNGYATLKAGNASKGIAKQLMGNKHVRGALRGMYGKMPKAMQKAAMNKAVGLLPKEDGALRSLTVSDFDMDDTVAFCATSTNTLVPIWINDSRFRKGKDANADASSELFEKLKKTGVIEEIIPTRKYYKSTSKFVAPDFFVKAKKGYDIVINLNSDKLVMDADKMHNGDHSMLGIFGVLPRSGVQLGSTYTVFDVSSTILEYYGIKSIKG